MATDFTVIQAVRQRFGEQDSDPSEIRLEQETPFVGVSKDFPFSGPNVDRAEMAILQFETLGASADYRDRPRNILRINGVLTLLPLMLLLSLASSAPPASAGVGVWTTHGPDGGGVAAIGHTGLSRARGVGLRDVLPRASRGSLRLGGPDTRVAERHKIR